MRLIWVCWGLLVLDLLTFALNHLELCLVESCVLRLLLSRLHVDVMPLVVFEALGITTMQFIALGCLILTCGLLLT